MSFSRMYLYISKQCMETGCFSSFSQFHGEARHALNYFMATAVIYLVLGVVLNVLQSRGVTLTSLFKSAWRRIVPSSESSRLLKYSNAPNATPAQPGSPSKKSAGSSSQSDVEAEQDIVDRLGGDGKCDLSSKYPIIANRVSKTYMRNGSPFQALHPTSLCLQKGQVLGLLGPNGAGKTTLVSVLTGLVSSETGEAWIGGSSIRHELPKVYKSIGVCPQFDLFWEDLTVEEHLLFYLRLKGSKHDLPSEEEEVLRVCTDVELREHRHKLAKALSGGMKRRLSLAIALIGNPDAIFLDEPTTGLDPLNREIFWGILQRIKKDKSIILTTHLMQEADYLSDRIGRP